MNGLLKQFSQKEPAIENNLIQLTPFVFNQEVSMMLFTYTASAYNHYSIATYDIDSPPSFSPIYAVIETCKYGSSVIHNLGIDIPVGITHLNKRDGTNSICISFPLVRINNDISSRNSNVYITGYIIKVKQPYQTYGVYDKNLELMYSKASNYYIMEYDSSIN